MSGENTSNLGDDMSEDIKQIIKCLKGNNPMGPPYYLIPLSKEMKDRLESVKDELEKHGITLV